MSEQSDTPRSGVLVPSDELKRLQRERDDALAKVAELVENGERLKAVADLAVRDAADMAEAKCALLRDRIERQIAEAQRERDEWQRIAAANGLAGLEATRERDEARAIANDRDAMVDHRDRALTAMYQRVDGIAQERDEARAELERLRSAIRWACGYDEGAPHFDPSEYGPALLAVQRVAATGWDRLAATEAKP